MAWVESFESKLQYYQVLIIALPGSAPCLCHSYSVTMQRVIQKQQPEPDYWGRAGDSVLFPNSAYTLESFYHQNSFSTSNLFSVKRFHWKMLLKNRGIQEKGGGRELQGDETQESWAGLEPCEGCGICLILETLNLQSCQVQNKFCDGFMLHNTWNMSQRVLYTRILGVSSACSHRFYTMDLLSHLAALEVSLASVDDLTRRGEEHISHPDTLQAEILELGPVSSFPAAESLPWWAERVPPSWLWFPGCLIVCCVYSILVAQCSWSILENSCDTNLRYSFRWLP